MKYSTPVFFSTRKWQQHFANCILCKKTLKLSNLYSNPKAIKIHINYLEAHQNKNQRYLNHMLFQSPRCLFQIIRNFFCWHTNIHKMSERYKITLMRLSVYKSVGSDYMHRRVLKEPNERVAKPHSLIFTTLWLSGEVPSDYKKGNINPIFKKGRREDLGNYQFPISLSSASGRSGNRSSWKLC